MARLVSDEEFESTSGLKVPKDAKSIVSLGQLILDNIRLLPPEHRQAFVETLGPEQLRLLHILEMPDLDDMDAVNAWLDS